MNQIAPLTAHVPSLIHTAGDRAQARLWKFFVSNIHSARRICRISDQHRFASTHSPDAHWPIKGSASVAIENTWVSITT
jgi:hypothetical protein